jgi:hypothetical protein
MFKQRVDGAVQVPGPPKVQHASPRPPHEPQVALLQVCPLPQLDPAPWQIPLTQHEVPPQVFSAQHG